MDELQREQHFMLDKIRRKQNAADDFIDEKDEEVVDSRYVHKNRHKRDNAVAKNERERNAAIALTQSQMSEDMGSLHEMPDDRGFPLNLRSEESSGSKQIWNNISARVNSRPNNNLYVPN